MATLALRNPLGLNEFPVSADTWFAPEPQGTEGKLLRENAQSAVEHWRNRAEYALSVQRAGEDYVSVPFKPVKKVRVTYRHVGPFKPAPYPLDE